MSILALFHLIFKLIQITEITDIVAIFACIFIALDELLNIRFLRHFIINLKDIFISFF